MKYLILLIGLCLYSNASWSSCIQGNCVNGYGTYTDADGNKYVGDFKNGGFNGQGIYTKSGGGKYVGDFKNGSFNGQGTYTWPDGRKYVGQFKDNDLNGQGTFTDANGNEYVGGFKDGGFNGQGTFTWPDGRTYVGQWENNKRHGQGTYNWPDGQKYVGQFKDGGLHKGTQILPDGRKYVGQFKYGAKHGQGTETWPDGEKYVGQFKDGETDQGTYYLVDGRQLIIKGSDIELHGANGQLLRAGVNQSEFAAIRGESAERKRLADEQSLEQGRREKTQIAGIQEQLIGHKYLNGIADGIPGNKTTNAVKAFYRDAGITRPDLDDYMTIAEDLYQKLLTPVGNCPYDSTSSSGYSVCLTFE